MELEHWRKDAKQLLHSFRARESEALQRAHEVLGKRAHERFQLGDAQHVVAVEHGYRSWPQLKHALEHAEPDRPVERIGLQPVSFYEERARELIAASAERSDGAIRRVRAHVPRLGDFAGGVLDLSDADLVIAREYGFGTWRELVRTVERVLVQHEDQREGTAEVRAALEAISRGDVVRLAELLDAHPELSGRCHNGAWATLLEAVAQPDVVGERLGTALGVQPAVIELLISRSDDLDGPLGLAACFNRSELVAMLLHAGANPAPDPRRGLTPLEAALYHGSVAAAELLVRHAISPLALWSAAALGRLDLMETMVDSDGNPLPAATAHRPNLSDVGWPPAPPQDDDRQAILDEALAYAAINGRDHAIEWLLDRGADVDGRPYLNVTPLHFAVQFGRASTVRLLLARGADPDIRDDIRQGMPLGWAEYQGRDQIARLLDPGRSETITDTGLAYRAGEPVRLWVRRRERRLTVTDTGVALAQAGRPAGWRAVAERLAREFDVNVSGTGAVWLPVVAVGPPIQAVEKRIAEASLTFYHELLELATE
ncbi:MAG: ankyrin repeat domain-containing protein [Solirubrobacterales bacterium]|nr:ankyrin repeat domain-containing protein [Solirubrobacterales bacterium]